MAEISQIKLPNGTIYDLKDTIRYNMTVSRGEQLVTNGSAMLGNNTNFTNWTFDGAKANSSAGSFTRTGNYANIGTDDYFPVNANEKYKFEFDLISQNNTGTMYGMLLFYDVDKKPITASDTMFYSGTLTTLTQDLKAGDTVIHLADTSNYKTYGTGSHLRALTFWDYSNDFGYLYPPETYSRNHIWSAWTDDSSIDKTNNTITLATAYTGATKPAGTYISQGCSGGTYKYSGIVGSKVPTTWTHYTGYFDGTDYSGLNKDGMFPPATAYCKVGFLWNYNSASDQFWLTNVSVKEVPKEAKHADTTDTSVYSYATGDESGTFKLYPQANNELNFGGSAAKSTLFFGYRAVDGQTAPTKYVFSGSTGTASLQCDKVYLGSGTTAYIDSTSYTGSAAKVNNHTVNSDVPANAIFTDTDTKVNMIARGTTKSYLLGTTTAPTSSNQAVSSVAETGVYFDTTAGTLVATTFKGALTGTASGNLTSSSTLSAAKLSGAIPSAVTATTQASTDNSTKIATTAYVTTAIANLPEPMLFKGSVGTGGTITSLPTAAASNEGWTYKVITALSSPAAKVGDTVISNGSSWVVIPSGDEPSGTVTSVGVSNATNGGLTVSGSPITSSGTITIGHSNVLTNAQTTQAVYPIKIDKNGHISAYGSAVTIPTVPSSTGSGTTGITASTTATKTTLGTAFTIPNVTSAGSASSWTFEEKTIPNVTAAGSGSASLTFAMDTTDTKKLKITFSHTHTAPTIGTAIKVQSKSGGSNGTAPTLGTAFTVPNVTGNTSATVSITDNGHTHTI